MNFTQNPSARSTRNWLLPAVAFQLCVVMVIGGTARPVNVLLCFAAALPTLFCLLAGERAATLSWMNRVALGLYGMAWLQLVPLPESVWTALPGRPLAAEVLDVTGLPLGWRPLALDPGAAAAGLLSLLSPLVLLVAWPRLSREEQQSILRAIVLLAILTAFLGIVQRVTGSLTIYDLDHAGFATGVFANRNHHAIFIACAIAMLPAVHLFGDDNRGRWIETALMLGLLMGLFATTSRAGILLGTLALVVALLLVWKPRRKELLLGTIGMVVLASILLNTPALAPTFERFETLSEDQRLIMAEGSWAAMRAFFPWGSGWGSFVPVYMARNSEKNGQQEVGLPQGLIIRETSEIGSPSGEKACQDDQHIDCEE